MALLDYHVEDVPLTVLAGHRRAPTGPAFATMRPRTPPAAPSLEGQALELDADAAREYLRWQPPRAPNMEVGDGHADPSKNAGYDTELTAWLDYEPK